MPTATVPGMVELTSVLKGLQTISDETVLGQLLAKLIRIVLENAGAQRGLLVLEAGGQLFIEAEGAVDRAEVVVQQSMPVEAEGRELLPVAIVNHVAQTRESVTLDDAARVGRFATDPYIAENQSRSILCVPLVYRDQLVGILYLENKLIPGAFTPERTQVIQLLSAQAAISIENVRLFEAAQRRVQEAETLYQAGTVVAATLRWEEAIERILEQLSRVVPYDSASVQLLREGYLEIVGGRGWEDSAVVVGMRFPVPGDNPNTVVVQKRQPHILGDAPAAYAAFSEGPGSHIRSWLGVPLIIHDRVIGMLAVDSTQPDYFTSDHARLATAFAVQVTVALENARLFDEARQRVAEVETLRRTSVRLASSLDLSTVLDGIAEGALALVGATDCLIYLYDEASESFSFGTALGRWAERGSVLAPRDGGLTATVVREVRPVVIDEAVGHPLYAAPEAQEWNIQAIAGLPLQRAGQVLGVLHVAFGEPHTFREGELRVLGLLADQAAIAIENARLFEAERVQLEELTVLHAVATAGAEATREDVLIERVTQIIGETLYPADIFGVMLVDEEAGVLHIHPSYQVMEGKRDKWKAALDRLSLQDAERILVPLGQGITGTVAASGKPWRVGDVTLVPEYIDGWVGTNSELCVPLTVGERVIGVVNAESPHRDAFSEDDERLLATVAGQLATAIEKVRLYEAAQLEIAERKQAEDELRKHRDHLEELVKERTAGLTEANAQLQRANKELAREIDERKRAEAEREHLLEAVGGQTVRQAALLRLSAELAATLEEGEVCRHVVDGLRDTLGYDFVALFLVDETTGERVHAASAGPIRPPARIPPGKGLSARPLLDGQLHYTPDVTKDPRYIYWLGGAEVDVPIRIGGEVLGVLIVESKQRDAFDRDDFEVLTAAAQQAGLAIEKARLLAAERQRADELDALRTTMADITAELELSTLLQAIVERATGLLDATGGELGLYDEANQEIRIVVSHRLGEDHVGARHALGEGAMGHVAETGEALIVKDYQTWEARAPQYADIQMHAALAAPLEVGGRLVGAITTADTSPDRQFTPADLHLLKLFAQQAAIAIENARLFGETERRLAELATLTEVGQALSSTLRVDEVLQLIYEQTRRVMYAENMIIFLYDPERHEVEAGFSNCPDDVAPGAHLPADLGVTAYVIRHRKSVLLRDNVREGLRRLGVELVGRLAASGLAVPMLRGERVLGVIILQDYLSPNVYDQSHQVLLETIASQAAIAIDNARLYAQAQREIAERVRAEEELREYQEHLEELVAERTAELQASEARYRTLFDGVPVGLYRTTPEGQIVDANLALVEMLGYPSREDYLAIGSTSVYVDPEERVRWQALMESEGVVRDFETQMYKYDGTVIWANDTARAVRDEQAQVLYYEGSLEDITGRRRAEEELRTYQEHLEDLVEERTAELRASEERYRSLFDGVPVGLYRSTPDGRLLDANLAFAQMAGYPSREDLLAVDSTARFYVDPEEQARWKALMEQQGVVRDFETRARRYDGTVAWVSDTARAVKDAEGQVLYYEGSVEDITERKEFEEEIRRQKDYFEALFVNSPVAVVTADLDGNTVSWNPMAAKLFGYTPDEAIGQNVDDLVANDDSIRAEAVGYTDQVMKLGRVQVTTKRTRKDGSLVDVELLSLPLIVAGESVGFIAIYHDISERKEMERELRRQKEYYEALFVNNPVAVGTTDLDINVVSWNPAAEKLFGYAQEEAIGKNLDDLVADDPRVREEALNYTNQVSTIGRVQAATRRVRKDGSLVDVDVLALPVIVGEERVGYIGIYHDITERKRFEEELRRQKEYFEALFVNSPVAVVTADLDGNIVSWNPMAERLFGYRADEVIDKPLDDFVAADDSLREEARNCTYQVINVGRVQVTTKRTRRDGALVDVELLGLPVIVAGEKVGFIAIYVDISDLQDARRQAETANQAKSTFLANMSHELRTPLNAILGFSQLMDSDRNLTAEQQENLAIINSSGEHLLALINDVLEMSKIEAGRVTVQERTFDLHALLDGLEEMFRLRAEDKGLALSFRRAEDVPQHVRADEGKLRQVLGNLLGNAVKFTQEGAVALRVTTVDSGQEPVIGDDLAPTSLHPLATIRFEVEDTGPGIAPEELEAVFDPFVQAAGGRESHEGTGLGLSISRQFVHLMGGELTATSEPGQGSLFQFDVQVGLADAAEVEAARPRRRVVGLAPDQRAADGGPYRLLVAEDRETNRRLLVRLLKVLGFEVREAVTGEEAIEVWERWKPHLIWMDMRMPVMDGLEATRQIKAAAGGEETVIIALTATAFEEDREEILAEGCDDFVRKPFRKDEIYDMLARHLGVRFIYEEEPVQPVAVEAADAVALPADVLSALPASWLADLRQATIRADLNQMLALVDQLRDQDPALADALWDLVQNYEYKKILALVEQAGG